MIKIRLAFFCLLIACFLNACVSSDPSTRESSYKPLFDGKTLKGWKASEKRGSEYSVENGVIVCPQHGGDLFTEREYSDFILRLDFKLPKGGNNGIAIRSPAEPGQIAYIGNEIQLLDDAAHNDLKPGQGSGSLYRIFPAKPGVTRIGEWNTCEITARGRFIKVVMNGETVVAGNLNAVNDPETIRRHPGMFRSKGHIGFLGHGARTEFRNIRVYEFPKYYPTDNVAPEGFTRLFDGRDLTGWRGLVGDPVKRKSMSLDEWARAQIEADNLMSKNWKVEKGTLVYRGKGFDNLCSQQQFGDFEMLVDWKVEPKADSGIYLRSCPQVQIWEPKSGGHDPKHPGSGGLFNNKKSANYPSRFADYYVGEWNRFRIVMVGDKVHVFLNNNLVVDNVTLENFWERDKTVYPMGPIELQAHQSVVHFKNIFVREILPTSIVETK